MPYSPIMKKRLLDMLNNPAATERQRQMAEERLITPQATPVNPQVNNVGLSPEDTEKAKQAFSEFTQQPNRMQQIGRAMQGIGSGLSGFAAPFLGQTYTPPDTDTSDLAEWMWKEKMKKKMRGGYEGTAKWKKKNAQSALFAKWLQSLKGTFPEGKLDRLGPTWSKNEVIKAFLEGKPREDMLNDEGVISAGKVMNMLGLTRDNFYDWAKKNQPDLAKHAFPARTIMEK